MQQLATIGREVIISVAGIANVPAKVDTGADSSSIWATDIREHDGQLQYTLLAADSDLYHSKTVETTDYETVKVTSSNGQASERFVVYLPVQIDGQHFERVRFTLADRSTMVYPVLLGRHFLSGSFVVDVQQQLPDTAQQQLRQERDRRTQRA